MWAVLWVRATWRTPWSYWRDESSLAWLCTDSLPLWVSYLFYNPAHWIVLINRLLHLFVLLSSEHSIIPISSECQHLFPAKIISRLARWTTISYQEYMVCKNKTHQSELQLMYTSCLTFFYFCRNCRTHVMWLMPGWQRRVICTLWEWLKEAQVNPVADRINECYW